MKNEKKYETLFFRFILFSLLLILSCNTTTNVYKHHFSKNEKLTIKSVTLSHCGCTQLYAAYFLNNRLEFQIEYFDNIARKSIYDYSGDIKNPKYRTLLASAGNNFTTQFDSLDLRIFHAIDSVIDKKIGIVYPIKKMSYKGYIVDTLLNR